MGYLTNRDLNREFGFPDTQSGRDYLGGRNSRDYSGAPRETGSAGDRHLEHNPQDSRPFAVVRNFLDKYKISVGGFGFKGKEVDLGGAGAMVGVIQEWDTKNGFSSGGLVEGWGGNGVAVGGGRVIGLDSEGLTGTFGFVGVDASSGPLAGLKGGFVGNRGDAWGGFFVEAHVGIWARGGGFYIRKYNHGGD